MKKLFLITLLAKALVCQSQCATIDIGLNGSIEVCPDTQDDDQIFFLPGPCYDQATTSTTFFSFESDGWGVVSLIVNGGYYYDWLDGSQILYTSFVMYESDNGCIGDEIFATNTDCNGQFDIWVNSYEFDYTAFWDAYWIGASYQMNFVLPEGEYIIATGNIYPNFVSDPPGLAGCSTFTIINIPPLGLGVWENYRESGGKLPYKLWLLHNYTLDGRIFRK